MLKELVKIANKLDFLGLTKEADVIDQEIVRLASEEVDETLSDSENFKEVLTIQEIENLLNTKFPDLTEEEEQKFSTNSMKKSNIAKRSLAKNIMAMSPYDRFFAVVSSGAFNKEEADRFDKKTRKLINDLFSAVKADFSNKKEEFYNKYLAKVTDSPEESEEEQSMPSETKARRSISGLTPYTDDYLPGLRYKIADCLSVSLLELVQNRISNDKIQFFVDIPEHIAVVISYRLEAKDSSDIKSLEDIEKKLKRLQDKFIESRKTKSILKNSTELVEKLKQYDSLDFYQFYLMLQSDPEVKKLIDLLASQVAAPIISDEVKKAFEPVKKKMAYVQLRLGKYGKIESILTSSDYAALEQFMEQDPNHPLWNMFQKLKDSLDTEKTNNSTSLAIGITSDYNKLLTSLRFTPNYLMLISPQAAVDYLEELKRDPSFAKSLPTESKMMLLDKLHEARVEAKGGLYSSKNYEVEPYTKTFLSLLSSDDKENLMKMRTERSSYKTQGRGISLRGRPPELYQPDLYSDPEVATVLEALERPISSRDGSPNIVDLNRFTREDAKKLEERVERQREKDRRRRSVTTHSDGEHESRSGGAISSSSDLNDNNFYVVQLLPKVLPLGKKYYWIVKQEVVTGDEESSSSARKKAEMVAEKITESYMDNNPGEPNYVSEGIEGEAMVVKGLELKKLMNEGLARLSFDTFHGPVVPQYGRVRGDESLLPEQRLTYDAPPASKEGNPIAFEQGLV
jgi:hypothetical protein